MIPNDLEQWKVKGFLNVFVSTTKVLNITSFHPNTNIARVRGHYETSATKIISRICFVKGSSICPTASQIAITFALCAAIFGLHTEWPQHRMTASWNRIERYVIKFHSALLYCLFRVTNHYERTAQNDLKWPWTLHGQRHSIYVPLDSTPESQIHSVLNYFQRLRVAGQFETNAWNDPKWPWRIRDQCCPIYITPLFPSHKFQSVSLYGQTFSNQMPFWDKCTDIPQNNLEYHKVNDIPYMIY